MSVTTLPSLSCAVIVIVWAPTERPVDRQIRTAPERAVLVRRPGDAGRVQRAVVDVTGGRFQHDQLPGVERRLGRADDLGVGKLLADRKRRAGALPLFTPSVAITRNTPCPSEAASVSKSTARPASSRFIARFTHVSPPSGE